MYGKLFASMYEGTLYGQWEGIVTLQQFVILADEDGVVDMTPPAIAARTSIPIHIILDGIEQLSQSDKYSRTPTEDGRRITLIDEDRPWGWRIVNYRYYRDLASREDKKQKDRKRIAEKRSKNSVIADCRKVSQSVANVAHTNTDTDTKKEGAETLKRFALPEWVDEKAWSEFDQHRRSTSKLRSTWNDLAKTKSANQLKGLSLEQQRQVVDYSIAGGYPGLYPERIKPVSREPVQEYKRLKEYKRL